MVRSESPWNQSGNKGKCLWRKGFAEEPSLKFRMKDWTSNASGDGEDGEDDDEVPCVIGESEGDCVWRGSRRSVGSSFHRQGAVYRKERLVIFKGNQVGGRARVTIDEERVLWQGWTEIKFWSYWGWFVVRTLYVRERSLYLMRSFILSQCRNLRIGVMWEDFGVLVTARARVLGVLESFYLRLWKIIVQWITVVKFTINDRSGDGAGSFEVKIRTNTAKFTNNSKI